MEKEKSNNRIGLERELKYLQSFLFTLRKNDRNNERIHHFIQLIDCILNLDEFKVEPIAIVHVQDNRNEYSVYDEKHPELPIAGYQIISRDGTIWARLHAEDYNDNLDMCEAGANIFCEKLNYKILQSYESEWFDKNES